MNRQNTLTIIITTVIFIMVVFFLDINKQDRIQKYIQKQHRDFDIQFNTIYKDKMKISRMIYNDIINDKHFSKILMKATQIKTKDDEKKIREELYNLMYERYMQWRLVGIQQLHFHTKNNISFLRMHQKDKYDDNLTNIRESVRLVNKLKKPIQGFEVGKVKSGFRFVFPVFYNNIHLGSAETSVSTEQFEKEFEQSFHKKIYFIIKKDIIDKKSFKDGISDYYRISNLNPNYYTHNKHNIQISQLPQNIKKQINNKLKTHKIFSVFFMENNHYKLITFYPIQNIKDHQTIAYFVMIGDALYLDDLNRDFYMVISILFILYIMILFYMFSNNRYQNELKSNLALIHEQKEELAQSIEELEQQNIQIAEQMEENRKKDTLIAEQSRLASLGEMIGNIAHQWRQPLSAISTNASSITLQNDLGILDCKNELKPALEQIISKTQFLSQTIEDFRYFIEGRKESVDFIVSSAIDNALNIADSAIQTHHIDILKEYNSIIEIKSYKNEFIQALLNIINNACDALKNNIQEEDNRVIFITLTVEENNVIITICDNAGGIPDKIKSKIFEPYFTTKHKSQGTGLGLYMTYKIITESMQGTIKIENSTITYKDKEYLGANFIITLPLTSNDCYSTN